MSLNLEGDMFLGDDLNSDDLNSDGLNSDGLNSDDEEQDSESTEYVLGSAMVSGSETPGSETPGPEDGNAVYRVVFRYTKPELMSDEDFLSLTSKELLKSFETISKYVVFQAERGEETSKLHYQGYASLRIKVRPRTLAKSLNGLFSGIYIVQARSSEFECEAYATKEDTRVSGPFSNKEIYLGADVVVVDKNRYSWQDKVLSWIGKESDLEPRKIFWIFDPVGGTGKSLFSKFLCLSHSGQFFSWGNARDFLFASVKGIRLAVFDFTRTKPPSANWSEILSGIEQMKNGLIFVAKYMSVSRLGCTPHIIVFSNSLPGLYHLTVDRWSIHRIGHKSKKLYPVFQDGKKVSYFDDCRIEFYDESVGNRLIEESRKAGKDVSSEWDYLLSAYRKYELLALQVAEVERSGKLPTERLQGPGGKAYYEEYDPLERLYEGYPPNGHFSLNKKHYETFGS